MIVRLHSTPSTMQDASALAAKGAAHGTVVVAECQTAGIGRHGHSWHSAPDGGLYFSMILRLNSPGPAVTLALGLAVQAAIEDTDLRWPNDVMLHNRKLAGILVQAAEGALIAGIGVNVNQSSFPDELRDIATSLRLETGFEHDKDAILHRIIAETLRTVQFSKNDVIRRFEERSSYARGREVEVDGKLRGVTAGLDADGFLLLRTDSGIERIVAGGVRPVH